jgi:RNA 2',3'-cyclic 3'-phosphodiesterase
MSEPSALHSRRLFFALWPADDLRARIESDTGALVERAGGRRIQARNLHVTLLFLGDVPAARIDAVVAAAAETSGNAFQIWFDQVETWPGSNVLCLTSQHPPAAFALLAEALRSRLTAQSFEFRKQVFRPHITLARDLPRMRSTESIPPLHWPVGDFVLVESNMTRSGSRYSVLSSWPLASAPTPETL